MSAGMALYVCVMLFVCTVAGFVGGWFLGKQDAEIKAERKRDAEADARLGL